MQSIYNYYQPDFYHFSRNSVELAKAVAEDWQNIRINFLKNEEVDIADFFSGSGVVVFEFFSRIFQSAEEDILPQKWRVDGIEVQNEYHSIWKNNSHLLDSLVVNRQIAWNFIHRDIFSSSLKKYHLILANPPFYSEERALASENPQKNLCHFMSEKKLKNLPHLFYSQLVDNGVFYFLAHPSSLEFFWKKEIASGKLKVFKELRDAIILKG